MKPLLHPRFLHDPFGDPGLYVGVLWERRAFLFDLGDLSPLSPRALLKVSDIFVSHAHMDHFIGFDQILRFRLHNPRTLKIYGPPGLVQNVAGKLSGYTWDRVDEYPFVLEVYEYGESGRSAARFACSRRFQKEDLPDSGFAQGDLLSEDWVRVGATELGRQGVTPQTLKQGDRVVISGLPGRNPTDHRVRMTSLRRPSDGFGWKILPRGM